MKRDRKEIKKSLGQHYLVDKHLLKKISGLVYQHDPKIIIEIGAGTGLLTQELLLNGGHVHAIEIEKKSIDELKKILNSNKNLTSSVDLEKKLSLQHDDALLISYNKLIENLLPQIYTDNPSKSWPSIAICGNLPYNIAAKLIIKLLEEIDDFFEKARKIFSLQQQNFNLVFLIQKEVAKRMLVEKTKEKKSLISYLIAWYGRVKVHFDIKPNSFFPAPKVMSSVIEISIHQKPISDKENYFFYKKCLKAAFQNRRKILANSLMFSLPEYTEVLKHFFLKNPQLKKKRADDLTTDDYLKLALNLKENSQINN